MSQTSSLKRGNLSIDTNFIHDEQYRTTSTSSESNHMSPSSKRTSDHRYQAVATPTFDNRGSRVGTYTSFSRSSSKVSEQNPSERDTNVQVCVRLRPILPSDHQRAQSQPRTSPSNRFKSKSPRQSLGMIEHSSSHDSFEIDREPAWNIQDNRISQSEHTNPESNRRNVYTFDHSFGPEHTNFDIYNHTVKNAVISSMEGYHSSVFAYGQTATGKKIDTMGSSYTLYIFYSYSVLLKPTFDSFIPI